jgi:hypothetical protein
MLTSRGLNSKQLAAFGKGTAANPTKGITMVVMEKRPGLETRSGYEIEFGEAELSVERTDITFHDVPGGKVRLQVTVHNRGTASSQPTSMKIESAPLGAFVPWRPLAQLVVPALEAGESREMSVEVERPRPKALGAFDRVPPNQLLTAVSAPDESEDEVESGAGTGIGTAVRNLMGWRQRSRTQRTGLAQDLWDLVGRGQPYWAGNINVFIGKKAVERHRAQALRIYPGRTNMAMFVVGGFGKRDAYSFALAGVNADWNTTLYEGTNKRDLLLSPSDAPIEAKKWVESPGGLMVMLATQPPADCKTANLEVHVTQRSTGETAIVEFSMDATAKGPGCYVV